MARRSINRILAKRPKPPKRMFELDAGTLFLPAPDVKEWVWENILVPDGLLYNPDHRHLQDAKLAYLWANAENTRQGVFVGATCEIPLPSHGNPWQKERVLYQLTEWFGEVPDFLITMHAGYCDSCPDANWCSLTEHELYHAAQATDKWGAPKFHKKGPRAGEPVFALAPHDAEEFVGVTRRYGVGASARGVRALVEAGMKAPEIAEASIRAACGTCGGRV